LATGVATNGAGFGDRFGGGKLTAPWRGGLLAGLGERLVLVASPDDGVLYDVDRPTDLA
jgi:CTP:molybdopterin cytidylyltransferase MocA